MKEVIQQLRGREILNARGKPTVEAELITSSGITVTGGRYGLGSKDTPPSSVFAIYTELAKDEPRRQFTIGIVDDVTNLSLPEVPAPNTAAPGTIECKFWGLGGDGTVGANKNSIKIIGDNTDQYVQAYFEYDTKKSGGVTKSHLRFGRVPILSTYYVTMADFIACHNQSYIAKYEIVNELKEGGTFLLNCNWSGKDLEARLPNRVKRLLAERRARFYTIDANTMAGSDQLNVEKFLSADMSISKEGEGPQILIYHTHSQETFADSVPGDSSTSIVGVGEYLTRILTEVYGYKVLHYEGQFDVEARDDAYSVALEDIERVLPYLEDTDMAELSGRVIGKLRVMSDEEFKRLELTEAE